MAKGSSGKGKRRLAWGAGALAVGVGAALAAERILVGRARLSDPFANEPYGKLIADRTYEVKSEGATIHVSEMGPSDAVRGVVFLHGYCLDHTIWHHQMKELHLPGVKMLFYDARHHSRSRGGEEPTDIRLLARDLKDVLDHSGLEDVVLVGHSMGGMTVLEFCRECSDELSTRVKGIVLVNTTFTDALKTVVAAELIGPIERRVGGLIDRLLDNPRSANAFKLRADDLSFLLVRLFGFGPGASAAQMEYVRELLGMFPSPPLVEVLRGMRRFDMSEALDAIDVPALVIAGGADRITSVRASEDMAEKIPRAELVVFDGAGHTAMMERNVEFNELLTLFLKENLVR